MPLKLVFFLLSSVFFLMSPPHLWGEEPASQQAASEQAPVEPPVEVVALAPGAQRAVVKRRGASGPDSLILLTVGDSVGEPPMRVRTILRDRLVLEFSSPEGRRTFWLYPPAPENPARFRVLENEAPARPGAALKVPTPKPPGDLKTRVSREEIEALGTGAVPDAPQPPADPDAPEEPSR